MYAIRSYYDVLLFSEIIGSEILVVLHPIVSTVKMTDANILFFIVRIVITSYSIHYTKLYDESNEIIVFVQPYRDNCVMYFNHMLYFEEKQYRTIENYSKYMDVLWFSFKVRDNKKEYHYEIRTSFRDIANSIEGREIKVKLYDYSNSEYKEIRNRITSYNVCYTKLLRCIYGGKFC